MALQLPVPERLAMIADLADSLQPEAPNGDVETWTPEELAEMMRVEPLPPKEIIERGLLGTWADQGITDGAEWVNEQKRKRKERRKWQLG